MRHLSGFWQTFTCSPQHSLSRSSLHLGKRRCHTNSKLGSTTRRFALPAFHLSSENHRSFEAGPCVFTTPAGLKVPSNRR